MKNISFVLKGKIKKEKKEGKTEKKKESHGYSLLLINFLVQKPS